jgi:hypothetical protein
LHEPGSAGDARVDPSNDPRCIAVDWSGAATGAERKIWAGVARDGCLVELIGGRSRDEVADWLIAESGRDPRVIVGLDFAFAPPAWFLAACGVGDAPGFWRLASLEAERWLADCQPPFWGRPGRPRPVTSPGSPYRATELDVLRGTGFRPKSVFQVGGAGAVGTGSLRGMATLRRLGEAGFAIWPFATARCPLVVEIYPRLLTGRVLKSRPAARRDVLTLLGDAVPADLFDAAISSEDAFDAAVSAVMMSRYVSELQSLPDAPHALAQREGWIWYPGPAAIANPSH